MGRNWIHIKDGSKDDYDLVITSDIVVPQGQLITMTGTVTLNKDFGASYKYDIIIENGVLVEQKNEWLTSLEEATLLFDVTKK